MVLQRDHLYFAIILLCVPIQYFAVNYMGSTETNRNYAISKLVAEVKDIHSRWLRLEPWTKWCRSLLLKLSEGALSTLPAEDDLGESPAYEVLKFREKEGYFAQSVSVRDSKPPHIKFRVGQVIRHQKWGYRGVIIGWDETARAPVEWLKQMHAGHPEWKTQPNYSILVDSRDRTVPQITYVPQENIEAIRNTRILHPSIEDYFENFDGSQYLPRPWLKEIYPRD